MTGGAGQDAHKGRPYGGGGGTPGLPRVGEADAGGQLMKGDWHRNGERGIMAAASIRSPGAGGYGEGER